MTAFFQRLKTFFFTYERPLSSAALLGGFVFDTLTLTRIDLWLDNLILFTYLAVAAFAIFLVHMPHTRWFHAATEHIRPLAPFVMQFAFGGLFSGFVIFYARGATLASSWPFLLILVGLLVGNEFFRGYYERFTFHISLFFLALFSFAIFYVPIIVHAIGPWIFMLSGVISLGIVILLLYLLSFIAPLRLRNSAQPLAMSITGIFFAIHAFYFMGLIPPLPLSLKNAEVYHEVIREEDGGYRVVDEERPWYAIFDPRTNMHVQASEPVYAYSAVFAPTDLDTRIVHEWQYYNASAEAWVEASRVTFPIVGGRDGGYRGYSFKKHLSPGRWRVNVRTEHEQLLGRISFEVIRTDTPSPREVRVIQ